MQQTQQTFSVTVEGHGPVTVAAGSTYEDLARAYQKPSRPLIVAVKSGNILKELSEPVVDGDVFTWVDLNAADGAKIYQRSVSFLMIRAALACFEGIRVRIEHSLSKGLYCEFDYTRRLNHEDYLKIVEKMKAYVAADMPFVKRRFTVDEASAHFVKQRMFSKVALLKFRENPNIRLYELDGIYNYFYGYMVPSTGYVPYFEMIKYDDGAILMSPDNYSPFEPPAFVESPKIAEVFKESEEWSDIMGVGYVSNLNTIIESGAHKELIQIAEALHEKKVAQIADVITHTKKRVILIAGPSSSGKTTFANRLRVQLKVNGLHPITLSTDNYFVNRELTPLDENGAYDFESLDAVDVEQFNKDLTALLDGDPVTLPVFNFHTGIREYAAHPIQVDEHQPIIIEGIHGLNETLTKWIFKRDKFKIYISALTQLNIDAHNRIPTTQARLLRRIVRDHQFRGHSAQRTIDMWASVRRGEERNIFPFQEEADEVFNSALPYELSILKKHALPLLEAIGPDEAAYSEAVLLKKFLGYFISIEDDHLVPQVSILKEFIGGSGFEL